MLFDLQTRDARKRLEVRDKPSSLHLGYRKGKSITRWIVRWRTTTGYRTQVLEDVVPDDRVRANGSSVLSYQQATIKAMNMDTGSDVVQLKHCGFCGKPQTEVRILIAAPNTFICDECVMLCSSIVSEYKEETAESENDT
jgi:hypothetical protein